jgi:hypothetical protein
MSVNRWKLVAMPFVVLGLGSPALVNCGAVPGMPAGMGCAEMDSGDFSQLKFSSPAVDVKVKSFLEASVTFKKMAVDMETDLITSCGLIGKDIGVDAATLDAKADGGGDGAKKVCGAVAAKITDLLKANAGVSIALDVGDPSCKIDVEAMMTCLGGAIKPGELKAACSGGEISGKCDAQCSGTCSAEVGAACSGTCHGGCSGKCDATFSGTCGGNCKGKCDGKATGSGAKAKCAGKCEGSCDANASGSCGGTCDGKCDAQCDVKAGAKCTGTCSGGCSAEMKAPKCSGDFKPPSADPKKLLGCGLKGIATAKCDLPVKINVSGSASADITKLVASLQANLPKIIALQVGTAKKVGASVTGLVSAGAELKDVGASLGLHGVACVGTAIGGNVAAAAGIKANADVSVNLSVSVKGGGSAGASGSASAGGSAGG